MTKKRVTGRVAPVPTRVSASAQQAALRHALARRRKLFASEVGGERTEHKRVPPPSSTEEMPTLIELGSADLLSDEEATEIDVFFLTTDVGDRRR